ncbi:MAG: DUF6165 family protein [Ignavibacteria bacterium]|nr:DUF6165 family protein [Ignavibacteria bacterium]
MNAVILVSIGELVDKITILEIKKERIKDTTKLRYINKEMKLLKSSLSIALKENKPIQRDLLKLKQDLFAINLQLWNIENIIRKLEADKDFGKKFIANARKVYLTNDKRSALKNEINGLFGSSLNEVKQYTKY